MSNNLLNAITRLSHKPIVFEPIPAEDNDELGQAVNEPIYHDNHWDLHEAVDGEALQKFWDEAVSDLSTDDQ